MAKKKSKREVIIQKPKEQYFLFKESDEFTRNYNDQATAFEFVGDFDDREEVRKEMEHFGNGEETVQYKLFKGRELKVEPSCYFTQEYEIEYEIENEEE